MSEELLGVLLLQISIGKDVVEQFAALRMSVLRVLERSLLTASEIEDDAYVLLGINHVEHPDDVGVFQGLHTVSYASSFTRRQAHLQHVYLPFHLTRPNLVIQAASPNQLDRDFHPVFRMYSKLDLAKFPFA